MAAERPVTRERRPVIWPWLLMPVVVLLVFYALFHLRHPGMSLDALWSHTPAASHDGQ
ncbi:MAG: hypothetical protein PVS2B3_17350 [Steroidobacteraceae bacterium]